MKLYWLVFVLCVIFASCESAPNRSMTPEQPSEENLSKMSAHEQKIHLYRKMRESGDEPDSHFKSTNRAKQARRDAIKDHIETLLNIKGKVMPSVKEEFAGIGIFDRSKTMEATDIFANMHRSREHRHNEEVTAENVSDDITDLEKINDVIIQPNEEEEEEETYSDFTEKLQSFYPECSLPHRVERSVALSQNFQLHFFFRVDHSVPKLNHHINFLAGNFRIFQNEERKDVIAFEEREEKICITVSWIKKGINNKDLTYVLLDTKMVPRYQTKWLEFDILSAVQFWQKRPRKNFGLIIEVEDENRNKISASKIFKLMNCSDAHVRRPFPSVLDDISDELLDLNSANSETTTFMTEKLNTNSYPILDVCSVEIPDGESLPEQMPLLSIDMVQKMSKNVDKNLTFEENSSGSETIDNFPKLHNVHIRHRIIHQTKYTTTTSTTTTTTPTTTVVTSEFTPRALTDDDTLEKIEEIDFLSKPTIDVVSTDDSALFPGHDSRPFHHLRRHRDRLGVVSVPEFKPIRKRVVMSRQNLLATLQDMMNRQEDHLERERQFVSSELEANDY